MAELNLWHADQEQRTHSFRLTYSTLAKLTALTPTDHPSSSVQGHSTEQSKLIAHILKIFQILLLRHFPLFCFNSSGLLLKM